MNFPDTVRLCEVGPRDGLQNEKTILTVEQKVAYIEKMADAGFTVIEVGSFMHPKAVPQMATTDDVFLRLSQRPGVEYRALVGNKKGVERAVACGCKKVKLNVSASRAHNLVNLNRLPEETVAGFRPSVELAREQGLAVSGSISMPFGSPWEHHIPVDDVRRIIEAYIACGITEISLSDAAGMAVPTGVYELCQSVQETYPDVRWIIHLHNTRGMAMANLLAAMEAGVDTFDCALAGLGGCPFVPGAAGNIASEDVVHMLEEMNIRTGVDLDAIIAAGRWLESQVGRQGDSYIQRAGKNSDSIGH